MDVISAVIQYLQHQSLVDVSIHAWDEDFIAEIQYA